MVRLCLTSNNNLVKEVKSKNSKKKIINNQYPNTLNPFKIIDEFNDLTINNNNNNNNNNNLQLLINRYNPSSLKDLVGLENSYYFLKNWFYSKDYNNKNNNVFLLLIGDTGCGKSSLINIFCEENNISLYDVKYYSSFKTKDEIINDILKLNENVNVYSLLISSTTNTTNTNTTNTNTTNTTNTNTTNTNTTNTNTNTTNTNTNTTNTNTNTKKLVLIDEYQNANNDLFSVNELINYYSLVNVKIVIISSDSKGSRLNDLKKNHLVHYINNINLDLIKSWITNIIKIECIELSDDNIQILLNKCKNDKRLLLNILQFIKIKPNELNRDNNINSLINNFYKDIDIDIFIFINEIFDNINIIDINNIFNVYETDGYLLANLVHENYLDYSDDLDNIANSAEHISHGDTLLTNLYTSGKTFNPDFHCLESIIYPSYYSRVDIKKKQPIRTSVINNRLNILLNNIKVIDKINNQSNNSINNKKGIINIEDIFLYKIIIKSHIIKSKNITGNQLEFISKILSIMSDNIDYLETIYKHFSEFAIQINQKCSNRTFSLKFKENLKTFINNR